MEIQTIDKELINTDKLPDERALMIELVEGSKLREWAHEHNGACFVWAGKYPYASANDGWTTFYLRDMDSMMRLVRQVGHLLNRNTGGKYRLQVIESTE
jgi:hypothetical protein